MAGDWIPMRIDLDEDPAVVGIATSLGVDELNAIGLLWKLWSTASRQSTTGYLPNYSLDTIDRIVGKKGFGSALVSVGWLRQESGAVKIPNFENWLGESAKKRQKETLRKRKQRCHAQVGQDRDKEWDKNGTPVLSSSVSSDGIEGAGEREGIPRATGPPGSPSLPPDSAQDQAWPAFLTREWQFRFAGTQASERDPVKLDRFFADLIAAGNQPMAILEAIRTRKAGDLRETTWKFQDRFGGGRGSKPVGRLARVDAPAASIAAGNAKTIKLQLAGPQSEAANIDPDPSAKSVPDGRRH